MNQQTQQRQHLQEVQAAANEFLANNPDLATDRDKIRLVLFCLRNYVSINPECARLPFREKLEKAAKMARGFKEVARNLWKMTGPAPAETEEAMPYHDAAEAAMTYDSPSIILEIADRTGMAKGKAPTKVPVVIKSISGEVVTLEMEHFYHVPGWQDLEGSGVTLSLTLPRE